MKKSFTIEIATPEAIKLFRSYMHVRYEQESIEATMRVLRNSGADVPQELEDLNASKLAEHRSIREQIESIGFRVTVDVMDHYETVLGTKSGAIVYKL